MEVNRGSAYPLSQLPKRGSAYQEETLHEGGKTATLKPIVTGQSVVAIRYRDGIMMAADMQLCYGNQKKFNNIPRLFAMEQSNILLSCSGEYSDVQHLRKLLYEMETRDFVSSTPVVPKNAKETTGYLSRVFYSYRNKFDPLLNQVAVAGFDAEEPYLGYVDYCGTSYSDTYVATGLGSYFAVPLLRENAHNDMHEDAARALLTQCMTIIYSHDCLADNKIQIGYVTKAGVRIEEPFEVQPTWNFEAFTRKTDTASFVGCTW